MTDVELCRTAKKPKRVTIDRISGLPDDLISLILSSLSTKDAVSTSVLSKRWRSLWTLVPVLDFSSTSSKETRSFLRFFRERVRTLDGSLDVVRLEGKFDRRFGDWVGKIIASGVRELDLCMTGENFIKIPSNGSFTSKTLVSLRLERFSFKVELSVHLPYLKILHLEEVGYLNTESFSQFLSGCPTAEDVIINHDVFDFDNHYPGKIELPPNLFTSQTLLSLKLDLGLCFKFASSIHLPRLKILHLKIGIGVTNREFIGLLLLECTSLADLDIWASDVGERIKIPDHLFISKILVSLKLGGRISLQAPPSVHLPNLRILHLGGYVSMPDNFLNDLLSGCLALEKIDLKHLRATNKKSSSICFPILKRLVVGLAAKHPAYNLKIIAPALKYLEIDCYSSNGEIAWDLPNLHEAYVFLLNKIPRKLFNTIRTTKVLKLHHDGIEDTSPPPEIDLIPKFQLLECLEIHNPVGLAYFLPEILENSAKLQKLKIFGESDFLGVDVAWSAPRNVPHCLSHSLEVFEIRPFQGLKRETQMVRYILRKGRVLEKIAVGFFVSDAEQNLRAKKKLSAIPRCSRASRLYFV